MKHERHRFHLVLFVGIAMLFLSACTPAPYYYIVVEKIVVNQNIIYARASQDCSYCDENIEGYVYYASRDNGQTWEEITSPANNIVRILDDDQSKQSLLCLSDDSQICYRITGKEQVEISTDGGVIWQSDWQIPTGRKYYMQRRHPFLNPDITPLDIQTVESDVGYFVIVAVGNQGVLVKSSDGNWSRHAVGTAVPTPYYAASFREAWDVLSYDSELYLSIFIAVLCLFLVSVCVWITIFIKSENELKNKILTFWSLITLFLVALVFLWFVFRILILIFFFLSLAFLLTWLVFIVFVPRKAFSILALLLGVVFSVALFFCFLFPYQLWALGTIPVYETARVIAWIIGLVVLLVGLLAEFRMAVLAVRPVIK